MLILLVTGFKSRAHRTYDGEAHSFVSLTRLGLSALVLVLVPIGARWRLFLFGVGSHPFLLLLLGGASAAATWFYDGCRVGVDVEIAIVNCIYAGAHLSVFVCRWLDALRHVLIIGVAVTTAYVSVDV